jgi:hypothetical protein
MQEDGSPKKIALIFWGLTRSLKHIIGSLQENVISILTKEGYEVDVFIHTYRLSGLYSNSRHGLSNIKLDFDEYKLLEPKVALIDEQDRIVEEKLDLKSFRTRNCYFSNNYQSLDYYIISLYSQLQICREFEKVKGDYHKVLFLKSDMFYKDPFQIEWLDLADENNFVVPEDNCRVPGNYKRTNDRFCISTPDNAIKYGSVLEHLLEYSKRSSVNAELFLGTVIHDIYNMNIVNVPFRFNGISPNGEVIIIR